MFRLKDRPHRGRSDEDDIKDIFPEHILDKNIEFYRSKGMEFIPAGELKKGFIENVRKDIELLNNIKKSWFPNGNINKDPKLVHFKNILENMVKKEPNRKILS